jgi:hypothetical protein
MEWIEYFAIALTIALFKGVNSAVLCYGGNLFTLHSESDLLNAHSNEFLKSLDKRFGSRWLPSFYFTALSFIVWPFINWQALDPTHRHTPPF